MLCALMTPEAVRTLALLPEVAWITLDEPRWPLSNAPQPAQWLIHSPQANDAGFKGAGETIAIIDTGVDYKIADFGGGDFPNAKVVGGYDTADEDPDPLDCDGHGTQVAGVAAGPSGVAPDARVVAVKVFSSRDPASDVCERRTTDSEILQGIDWVASNAARFSIGVVNISLGIPFNDAAEHGFCDAEQPAYAMAVARLTAAGAAVFAAAGNDASPRFVSAPGCVTSANAVGAVYSEARTRAAWGDDSGGTLCVDEPALVDQVGCFSNSTRGVALLAPGAFWLVPTKDGLASAFAATSAATPAAAGAALLARQALPGFSPSAVAGILRLTGKPVADARNGLRFPRIDVLDAVHFARSRFFESRESPAPIPDGAGEARLRIAVPPDAAPISRLSVGVQADHPAPDQLQISLVDPAGRTIVLRNRTGTAARPVFDLYGELDAPAEPLDALGGAPPGGTWTLVVRDLVPGQTGRVLGFFLSLGATGRLAVDPPGRPRPAPRTVPTRPTFRSKIVPDDSDHRDNSVF
jgi:subtilisin-like proprotein convertase family protein